MNVDIEIKNIDTFSELIIEAIVACWRRGRDDIASYGGFNNQLWKGTRPNYYKSYLAL